MSQVSRNFFEIIFGCLMHKKEYPRPPCPGVVALLAHYLGLGCLYLAGTTFPLCFTRECYILTRRWLVVVMRLDCNTGCSIHCIYSCSHRPTFRDAVMGQEDVKQACHRG